MQRIKSQLRRINLKSAARFVLSASGATAVVAVFGPKVGAAAALVAGLIASQGEPVVGPKTAGE